MKKFFLFDKTQKIHLPQKADTSLFAELTRSYAHTDCEITNNADANSVKIGNADMVEPNGCDFAINVTPDGVSICANDYPSAIRGYISLLDKIKYQRDAGAYGIECGIIREKAAINFRSVHICVFEQTDYSFLKKCVRACGIAKYSHIVLEFWGMLKYDCMSELAWASAFSKEQVKAIVNEANAMGIEIIPMFNHLGHAAAGRDRIGKHVVLDQNPDYEYMFNTYGWAWDFENEEVYQLLKNVRSELMEVCGEGSYFHIGCDEAHSLDCSEKWAKTLCKYINRVQAELASEGRRTIMWGDMLLYKSDYANEPEHYSCTVENENTSRTILENLSKDIIIADWQYYQTGDTWKSSDAFRQAGFDVIACPWDTPENTKSGVKNALLPGRYGLMHTTWHTLSGHIGFPMMLYAGMSSWSGNTDMMKPKELQFYSASTARKVLPSKGVYEKAGWNDKEIGPGL